MKLVGICMFRDEADVLEAMIRYNLQFLDEIHLVNHHSSDASAEVVMALKEEGLPVYLDHETHTSHIQNKVLTQQMRKVATLHQADFVVPLDADECITGPGGNTRSLIERLPSDLPTHVAWSTYIPTKADNQDVLNHLQRITHRLHTETHAFYKAIIPRRLACEPRLSLGMGNHCLVDENRGKTVKKVHIADGLRVAHFPVRSAAQLMTKTFNGWLSIATKPDRAPDECYHWKQLYDRFSTGVLPDADALTRLAINYLDLNGDHSGIPALVHDPLPVDPDSRLRYTKPANSNPVLALARRAEILASEVAELRRSASRISRQPGRFSFWKRKQAD